EGAKVVIADRDESAGEQAAQRLGKQSAFIRTDVSSEDEVRRLVEGTTNRLGRIDFLVNSAGIIKYATAVTCTEQERDEVLSVNLKASLLCSKHASPVMKKTAGGDIINVVSSQSHISASSMAHYARSKSGLLGLMRSLSTDFAPDI